MKNIPACPRCLYSQLQFSKVRKLDWPLYAAGFVAVRCSSCHHRFFQHRLAASHTPASRRTSSRKLPASAPAAQIPYAVASAPDGNQHVALN